MASLDYCLSPYFCRICFLFLAVQKLMQVIFLCIFWAFLQILNSFKKFFVSFYLILIIDEEIFDKKKVSKSFVTVCIVRIFSLN